MPKRAGSSYCLEVSRSRARACVARAAREQAGGRCEYRRRFAGSHSHAGKETER
jgi:hypothetical protein